MLSARCANAYDFHVLPLYTEPFREPPCKSCRLNLGFVEVRYGPANPADKMMMFLKVRIQSQRTVMQTHFSKHPGVNKRLQVLINSAERNSWNLPPDCFENGFRCWMIARRHQRLIDDLPLMSAG